MSKARVLWGDILRVTAMLMVILLHAMAPYRYSFFDNGDIPQYLVVGWLDGITRAAVPIFFMLTGYFVLTKEHISYRPFIRKTIKNLVIPFIVFSFGIYVFLRLLNGDSWSLPNFIATLSQRPGAQYQMWFMYIMIIIYLFIPYISKFVHSLSRSDLLRAITLIFLSGNLLYTINKISSAYNYNLFGGTYLPDILVYTNYLLIGYYLRNYQVSAKSRIGLYIAGGVSLLLLPIATLIYTDYLDTDLLTSGLSIFSFFIGISGFIICQRLFTRITKLQPIINRLITVLSGLSFYIYMIHPAIIEVIRQHIYDFYAPNNLLLQLGDVLVQFTITLAASLVIALAYQKIHNLVSRAGRRLTSRLNKIRVSIQPTKASVVDATKESSAILNDASVV